MEKLASSKGREAGGGRSGAAGEGGSSRVS